MGLPDVNIKTNSTNFNTIQPKSRNHGHARAASMLDNYPSQNMGNHQGMQNNLMTPGLNRKLSQGSIESQGSLAQLHRNDSRAPEKFGGSQNINFGYMDMNTQNGIQDIHIGDQPQTEKKRFKSQPRARNKPKNMLNNISVRELALDG